LAWVPFPDGIVDALDPARLRLLVEVGRRGSVSAAAVACRIGQPSTTEQLQRLEGAVGTKLVERHGRASRLTEAGSVGRRRPPARARHAGQHAPAERAFIRTLRACCEPG
jgi:molybdenum-dependent DNA-binding transcriptional regulator ModE